MEARTSQEREYARRRHQRMRAAILAVIVVLVLGAAGYLIFDAFWSAHLVNTRTGGNLSWKTESAKYANSSGGVGS